MVFVPPCFKVSKREGNLGVYLYIDRVLEAIVIMREFHLTRNAGYVVRN